MIRPDAGLSGSKSLGILVRCPLPVEGDHMVWPRSVCLPVWWNKVLVCWCVSVGVDICLLLLLYQNAQMGVAVMLQFLTPWSPFSWRHTFDQIQPSDSSLCSAKTVYDEMRWDGDSVLAMPEKEILYIWFHRLPVGQSSWMMSLVKITSNSYLMWNIFTMNYIYLSWWSDEATESLVICKVFSLLPVHWAEIPISSTRWKLLHVLFHLVLDCTRTEKQILWP